MKRSRRDLCADLSAFLDGELSPERAEQVAGRIENDARLQAELRGLESTRRMIGSLRGESAPAGMLDAAMEEIQRKRLLHTQPATEQPRSLRWIRRFASAAIVLLTVALASYLYGVLSGPDWWTSHEHRPELAVSSDTDRTGDGSAPAPTGGSGRLAGLKNGELWAGERRGVELGGQANDDGGGKLANASLGKYADLYRDENTDKFLVGRKSAGVCNVVLATSNLELTNKKVYAVLVANGIDNVEPRAETLSLDIEQKQKRGRGSVAYVARQDLTSNSIVAYVDETQAPQVVAQLASIEGEVGFERFIQTADGAAKVLPNESIEQVRRRLARERKSDRLARAVRGANGKVAAKSNWETPETGFRYAGVATPKTPVAKPTAPGESRSLEESLPESSVIVAGVRKVLRVVSDVTYASGTLAGTGVVQATKERHSGTQPATAPVTTTNEEGGSPGCGSDAFEYGEAVAVGPRRELPTDTRPSPGHAFGQPGRPAKPKDEPTTRSTSSSGSSWRAPNAPAPATDDDLDRQDKLESAPTTRPRPAIAIDKDERSGKDVTSRPTSRPGPSRRDGRHDLAPAPQRGRLKCLIITVNLRGSTTTRTVRINTKADADAEIGTQAKPKANAQAQEAKQ